MATTTIGVDTTVRDRLRAFCGGGLSYSEALTKLMDQVEADRFFAEFQAAIDDPSYQWIAAEDIDWGLDKQGKPL